MSSQAEAHAAIPVLTAIHDPVSRRVAAYYAQRPYPQHLAIPAVLEPMPPSQHIRSFNSWVQVPPQPFEAAPEILVAGCGTGGDAFRAAQTYPNARVLGIDLSMPGLAYAQMLNRDSGLSNIEFAQADILELPSIGRRFDVIEARDVLHQMADPFAGFGALASMLRRGGFMRVGLHSTAARQPLYALRTWASENGYMPELESIARLRVALETHPLRNTIRLRANLAELRDQFFPPHEQAVTIAQIAASLSANNMRFLGFCFSSPHAREEFRRTGRTREDDLNAWASLEADRPSIFVSMYDFWAQAL